MYQILTRFPGDLLYAPVALIAPYKVIGYQMTVTILRPVTGGATYTGVVGGESVSTQNPLQGAYVAVQTGQQIAGWSRFLDTWTAVLYLFQGSQLHAVHLANLKISGIFPNLTANT